MFLLPTTKNLLIQSIEFIYGVTRFLISIEKSLRFTTFRMGIKVYISFLSKNRIVTLSSWSSVKETVMHLHRLEENPKVIILYQQIKSMVSMMEGKRHYDLETIVRAFEYFATSRAFSQKNQ